MVDVEVEMKIKDLSAISSPLDPHPKPLTAVVSSMFFGQKEDAPANLKRMTVKSFPDQYPAEKVLQAEPVPGDSKDIAVIRPLLKQTDLGVMTD